ncbi:hypothetical protein [Mucilaginibacter auburnensis]|uniref:Histidine kinase n=1 Tax=Mucilaginibacter auburnensis TaxID=1457233 RepID=A0A2H9VRZ5_9SPHI|nr:hypothetical protein [Mucilaginibacter auburnensis]PJJ83590.1 hypothetical protein CLV57_0575 [Mucilaginibacter auburnensis]
MEKQPIDVDALRLLKHDIKNQLSNIHLALDSLKYDLGETTGDVKFCIDAIAASAAKIDSLLKDIV